MSLVSWKCLNINDEAVFINQIVSVNQNMLMYMFLREMIIINEAVKDGLNDSTPE